MVPSENKYLYNGKEWQEGSDAVDGYSNIGESYTQDIGDGLSITYNQNTATSMTESVLEADDWVFDRPEGEKTMECFEASSQMVEASGGDPMNGEAANTITAAKESGIAKDHSVASTGQTAEAMNYMDSQINQGKSALVGVDYKHGSPNNDKITDHGVAISSQTTQFSDNSRTYTLSGVRKNK